MRRRFSIIFGGDQGGQAPKVFQQVKLLFWSKRFDHRLKIWFDPRMILVIGITKKLENADIECARQGNDR